MKAKFTLIVILALAFTNLVKSQSPHPFELGLNIGGSWYQSDIKMKKVGLGAGLTFGQTYCLNKTSPLFWGWRFRYLNANAYGQDFQKSYGIKNNFALNGTNDPNLDYFNNGGYVYQNYKSTLDEFSLELKIGANQLRQRTKILAYIFGGAGLTKAVTKIDQLDALNNRYNYNLIDSAGTASKGDILSNLSNMYDGNFETNAEGSKNPRWRFMPSFGVGLGYQVSSGFSIGFEHKITFALNDLLEGQQWTNTNEKTGTNDRYHYTSLWLKFSFGGRGHATSSTNTNLNSDITTLNNTTSNKPSITFTNPGVNPYNTTQQTISLTARVKDVVSKNDISLVINGSSVSAFSYNAGTDILSYTTNLNSGNNSIEITATNTIGSTTASQAIIYSEPTVVVQAPVVTITNPNSSPSTTNTNMATVNASISNVIAASQISVMLNGTPTSSFSFNSSTHQFNMNANLVLGSNAIVITASNSAGSDTKSTTIVYSQPVVNTTPAPIVTIVSPSPSPFNSNTNSQLITAVIQNITAKSQINATVNGGPIMASAISYNSASGQATFSANLLVGVNTVVVGATNVSGADSKNVTIIYSQPTPPTELAPSITITNPISNPFNTSVNTASVTATILNVSSSSQITVKVNGLSTSAFSFNSSTHQFNMNTSLVLGANTIAISAINSGGADSKNVTIIYSAPAPSVQAPVVTITNPASSPYTTTANTTTVNATVLNITNSSQLNVSVNGMPTSSFTFNASSHQLSLNTNLILGSNSVVISATNAAGNDTKSGIIIYNQPVVNTTPAPVVTIVNPSVNPFNTTVNSQLITAVVQNITAKSQINASVNGGPIMTSAISFNTSTGQASFTANLIMGANTIVVGATNVSGADSKSTTIIYSQPAPTVLPPVVTITSPTSNPFNTTVNTSTVTASITNITSSSQLSVMVNGVSTSAFSFNSSSHQLSLNTNLVLGANSIVITATNSAGIDSKSVTIMYSIPAPTVLPPVVIITSPTSNPFNTTVNTATITANVSNITSSSQLNVKINGVSTSAYSFNSSSHQLSLTSNLVLGANSVVITATNSAGVDSKSVTIMYSMPAPTVLAPVVTITSPSSSPFTSSATSTSVVATDSNVTSSSQINVSINGIATTAFTYNNSSNQLNLLVNLSLGSNTVVITAANSAGTDSKSTTIMYSMPAPTLLPPTVSFLTPATSPLTVNSSVYVVTAKTTNVSSASQIVVKVNGVATTAFTFVPLTRKITLNTNLNAGSNTVVITVTNASGSDTKSATLVYEQVVNPILPDTLNTPSNPNGGTSSPTSSVGPVINMIHPISSPYNTSDASINIAAKIIGIDGPGSIIVKVNGNVVNGHSYTVKTKMLNVLVNLNSGTNIVTIQATNSSGSKTETITINK